MDTNPLKDDQEKNKPLCRRSDTHGGRDCDFLDVCEQRVLVHGGYDYGLAPALALRSLKLFGGDVRVCNTGSEGFVITATLPENSAPSGENELTCAMI